MKLYTKRGDDGLTDLFGGQRVSKASERVSAYGEVDELNAVIGLAVTSCNVAEITDVLRHVQSDLFVVGSELAGVDDSSTVPRISDADVERLEHWIDDAEQEVPALSNFVLPGGSVDAATLHMARTVCRRGERAVVAVSANEMIRPLIVIYLNRLSDLLFALARRANHRSGTAEDVWIARPE